MFDARLARKALIILGAVTAVELAALFWVFQKLLLHPARLTHYLFYPHGNLWAWLLTALTAVLYTAFAIGSSPLIGEYALAPSRWSGFARMRIAAIAMALITGIFEEVVFRRVLMDAVLLRGGGIGMQIAISAITFGAVHCVWALFGGNQRAATGPLISTTILGLLLALVYVIGGRALIPCIAAHVGINLVLEPWLILTALTGSWGRSPAKAQDMRIRSR